MEWILRIYFPAIHIFERGESRDVETAAEGRHQVRRRHGSNSALVSLHARAVHPGTQEFRGCGVERSRSPDRGDENQLGNSGYGRSAGDTAARKAGRRPGREWKAG